MIKELFNQKDKLQHILAGIGITQVLYIILSIVLNPYLGIIVSGIITTIVGYLKEWLWDRKLEKGTYNIKDFYATLIGIVYSIIILLLLTI